MPVSAENNAVESELAAESKTAPVPAVRKKAYRPPRLSLYGRIERTTAGGSGMAKESFAMETFRFP